jgi:glutaredoxin
MSEDDESRRVPVELVTPNGDEPARTSGDGIVLFTAPDCAFCRQAREYLTGRQAVFTEYDVTRDDGALRRLLWLTGTATVPTTIVNGAVLVGFDEERLGEMFDGPLEIIEELTAPSDPEDVDIW